MKHFTDERWLDFARWLLSEDETLRMQAPISKRAAKPARRCTESGNPSIECCADQIRISYGPEIQSP